MERIKHSKKRPLAIDNDARKEYLKDLRRKHEPLYEELVDITYDTFGKSLRKAITEILYVLWKSYKISPIKKTMHSHK